MSLLGRTEETWLTSKLMLNEVIGNFNFNPWLGSGLQLWVGSMPTNGLLMTWPLTSDPRWWRPSRCCVSTSWSWRKWATCVRTSVAATSPACAPRWTVRPCLVGEKLTAPVPLSRFRYSHAGYTHTFSLHRLFVSFPEGTLAIVLGLNDKRIIVQLYKMNTWMWMQ